MAGLFNDFNLFPAAYPSMALFGGETCQEKCIEDKLVMEQLSAFAIAAAVGKPYVESSVGLGFGAGIIQKACEETDLHIQGNERKAIIDKVKEGKGGALRQWVEFLAKTLASCYTSSRLFFGLNERSLMIIVPVAIKTLAQLILKSCPVPCVFNPECEASKEVSELTHRFVQQLLPRLSIPPSPSRALEVGAGISMFDQGLASGNPFEAAVGAGLVRDGLRL